MTIESQTYIRIPSQKADEVIKLARKAETALARAKKLSPGDRTEAVRFEALHAVIDQFAIAAMGQGEPYKILNTSDISGGVCVFAHSLTNNQQVPPSVMSWIEQGFVVVKLNLPHFDGVTRIPDEKKCGPPDPKKRWSWKSNSTPRYKEAVQKRFEYLLREAVENNANGDGAIRPSGVANSVLTEGLRKYVQSKGDEPHIDVPVIYRDGSQGPLFPLHSLDLTNTIPDGLRTFKFTLMSIRHVEMDSEVDGAWLRNVKISQQRVAGLTDEVVFETSLRQFNLITKDAPVLLYLFQTGLDTAIVGFYRALACHLFNKPGSITVVPQYYHDNGPFTEGTVWATR